MVRPLCKLLNIQYTIIYCRVLCVACDPKRIATGSGDRTIKLWDFKSGHLLQTLKGHNKGVWCLRFFTKHLLVSGSYDSTLRVRTVFHKF